MIAVIAFGGNALLRPEDNGTVTEQLHRANDAAPASAGRTGVSCGGLFGGHYWTIMDRSSITIYSSTARRTSTENSW